VTPPISAARVLRGLARRWHLGLLGAAAIAFATPIGMLSHGTDLARACVAEYEAPRGEALPECRGIVRWFVTPSRIPWTATSARYRAEELNMRAAIADYHDAAVGKPDAGALLRSAEGVVLAEKVIKAGSQRVSLEELGRAVGAPDLGRSAVLYGDRRTLVQRADQWDFWPVRQRTLEAALLEGDVPRATAIAKRYAEFDPRDEDVRTAIAAVLCLRGEGKRAIELFTTVQNDRARERHESWARNWGEVRAAMVACAERAGLVPPPLPEHTNAGQGDHPAARAALRLRVVAKRSPGDTPELRAAAFDVIQLLKTATFAKSERVRVLAALLASGHAIDEGLAAALATPRLADGEAPILPAARSITAIDWLAQPRVLEPSPPREALREGAAKLRRMAGSKEISAEERLALTTAAAAMAIDAARAFAIAGDGAGAAQVIDEAGAEALSSAAARALARATAWYVAGDPARALAEVEKDPADLADDAAVRVAFLIQRAELYAAAGRREDAGRAAIAADEAAAALGDRGLEVRALWTRLALAKDPLAPLRAPPPPPLPGPRTGHDGAASGPKPPGAGAPAWPWVGELATPSSWLSPEAESPVALARALGFWFEARRASPADRRAIRYAAIARHRGDAPRAVHAYLAIAGDLLAPGEGDVEVWLDTFAATWSRRLGLRSYAWARAEAARFRGDAAAAARWSERHRALVALASGEGGAELAAIAGL
jgi:hypothetical protein